MWNKAIFNILIFSMYSLRIPSGNNTISKVRQYQFMADKDASVDGFPTVLFPCKEMLQCFISPCCVLCQIPICILENSSLGKGKVIKVTESTDMNNKNMFSKTNQSINLWRELEKQVQSKQNKVVLVELEWLWCQIEQNSHNSKCKLFSWYKR